jgi:hypothetical protein
MVIDTDGNTYAINRHLEEREQYDMAEDMQGEIDTLHDEVDRLRALIEAVDIMADEAIKMYEKGFKPNVKNVAMHIRGLIAACEADE